MTFALISTVLTVGFIQLHTDAVRHGLWPFVCSIDIGIFRSTFQWVPHDELLIA